MRDRTYLASFLLGAGVLLYLGRGLLEQSAIVNWALTFGGTTAVAILGMTLYRVQLQLRASRHELARKEAELNFALEVQQALFPRRFPLEGGLEFAATCIPARGISGDYYDVIQLADKRLVLALADISGKGISAAILMSNLHALLRALAAAAQSPGEVCSQLNRHLYQITDASRFATLFYAEWNCAERRLCYVNAGHNVPIVLGSSRGRRLEEGGLPLGMFASSEFQVGRITLQAGDTVVVYSDGITEATGRHGEQFGEARLEAIVATHSCDPLAVMQHQVLKAVRDWAGQEPDDDMTLLIARATAPTAGERL